MLGCGAAAATAGRVSPHGSCHAPPPPPISIQPPTVPAQPTLTRLALSACEHTTITVTTTNFPATTDCPSAAHRRPPPPPQPGYKPSHIIEGRDHPDPIVEAGSLASVKAPEPTYDHTLGELVADGTLSNAQIETVVYSNMRFGVYDSSNPYAPPVRQGFFLGDGAGVGKGRQIAALIKDLWNQVRLLCLCLCLCAR